MQSGRAQQTSFRISTLRSERICGAKMRIGWNSQLELINLRCRFVQPAVVAYSCTGDAPANDHVVGANFQLPAIQLPTFAGEWDEWVSFRDVFRALVNDD